LNRETNQFSEEPLNVAFFADLAAKGRLMKAIVFEKYGSPDVVKLDEVQKPAPADNQLLIKVHAVSINRSD